MIDPADTAHAAIRKVIQIGSLKEGRDESWRKRDVRFHIMKSISHNLRALQLLEGHIIDEETVLDHVERATTRDSMALTILLDDVLGI
jgi:hypothetical protein